jgi:hypothetical protein
MNIVESLKIEMEKINLEDENAENHLTNLIHEKYKDMEYYYCYFYHTEISE